jgi:hypothetical protein
MIQSSSSSLLLILLMCSITFTLLIERCYSATITINTNFDTYSPSIDTKTTAYLFLTKSQSETSNIQLRFPLSSIPAGSTITSATLLIPNPITPESEEHTGVVKRILVNTWSADVQFSNRPATTDVGAVGVLLPLSGSTSADVTGLLGFDPNYLSLELSIQSTVTCIGVYIYSALEDQWSNPKIFQLQIQYTPPECSIKCGTNLQCCKYSRLNQDFCYSSSNYKCALDENDSTKKCLCTVSNNCFNGYCYNPATHHVVIDDYTGSKRLCGVNLNSCNNACYQPSNYFCCHGALKQTGQPCV